MIKNINYILLCISVIFNSCKNSVYNKIDIRDEDIESITSSMLDIELKIDESSFDTTTIREYKIRSKIQYELLYVTNVTTEIRDSIEKNIFENFNLDDYYPFMKSIYCTSNGNVFLNERFLAKNDGVEFENEIYNCRELHHLTTTEKKRIIDDFRFLKSHNIWGYITTRTGQKFFKYSKDNLAHSETLSRFLYLKSDTQGNEELNTYFELIDSKSALFLYKRK